MTSRQVLTIEDDAAIRRGIVDALTFAGYQVCEAARGDEGLQMAVQRSFETLHFTHPARDVRTALLQTTSPRSQGSSMRSATTAQCAGKRVVADRQRQHHFGTAQNG